MKWILLILLVVGCSKKRVYQTGHGCGWVNDSTMTSYVEFSDGTRHTSYHRVNPKHQNDAMTMMFLNGARRSLNYKARKQYNKMLDTVEINYTSCP